MTAALTSSQALTLTRLGVLIAHHDDALSAFEADLCREVRERFVIHGRATVVTDLEWPVIEASVAAMRKAAMEKVPAFLRLGWAA